MSSYGVYGLDRVSPKVLIGTFVPIVLTPLIAVALKASNLVGNIVPIIGAAMTAISIAMLILGTYMFKHAILIRTSYIKAKAKIIDVATCVGGRRLTLLFTHNSKQHKTSVLLSHGYKRKGKELSILFDPEQPSIAYIYDVIFFFTPLVPLILSAIFGWLLISKTLNW